MHILINIQKKENEKFNQNNIIKVGQKIWANLKMAG